MQGPEALAIIMGTNLFQPGNKLAKGGRRLGGGAKTKQEIHALEKVRATLERLLATKRNKIAAHYMKFIGEDPATCRHAVDKVLPDATPAMVLNIVNLPAAVEFLMPELPKKVKEIEVKAEEKEVCL